MLIFYSYVNVCQKATAVTSRAGFQKVHLAQIGLSIFLGVKFCNFSKANDPQKPKKHRQDGPHFRKLQSFTWQESEISSVDGVATFIFTYSLNRLSAYLSAGKLP